MTVLTSPSAPGAPALPKETKATTTTIGAVDIDDFTARVLNVGTPNCALLQTVTVDDIVNLCQVARTVFLGQPSLIELEPPVKVCGDTHGQYSDVLRLFDRGGFPPYVNYLFLGDYVDRGHQNLESILLFLCFKVKYPGNFFLLRGNHECAPINRVYGFYEECQRRYQDGRVWNTFQDVFNTMPFVGLIGGRILCMHGGLSPKLKHISQLKEIQRPSEPQNPSLQMDLLWADPDQHTKGWQQNTRGVSVVFGPDVVHELLSELDLDLVARAHQVVQDGYEFFANKKLVTIFSAPHYCGQFDNAAAMMNVDTKLICSFHVMRPTAKPMKISSKN